jgi:hypothetical protein
MLSTIQLGDATLRTTNATTSLWNKAKGLPTRCADVSSLQSFEFDAHILVGLCIGERFTTSRTSCDSLIPSFSSRCHSSSMSSEIFAAGRAAQCGGGWGGEERGDG